ncbi:hypothetical protein Tco_1178324 [Tanacetum coccineum]
MDWSSKYHGCDEKLVHIPFGNETLMIQPDRSDGRCESRLNIISYTETQKYMLKGCHVFLARITEKKLEKKSEEKRLEDVPVVREYPKFLPQDLSGLPPTRQSKKEHKEQLKLILELLKNEELYAKFSKCEFWNLRVQFLGHMIDSQGIHVDPAKIESIKDWETTKTPKEIRQFLGLVEYY